MALFHTHLSVSPPSSSINKLNLNSEPKSSVFYKVPFYRTAKKNFTTWSASSNSSRHSPAISSSGQVNDFCSSSQFLSFWILSQYDSEFGFDSDSGLMDVVD